MSKTWTEEEKNDVVADYLAEMDKFETDEEKGANTTEVTKLLAEKYDRTPNGVRMVLIKAEAYITKQKAASKSETTGAKRVNKAQAHQDLKDTIARISEDLVDEALIEKMTGAAALYFTNVIQSLQ